MIWGNTWSAVAAKVVFSMAICFASQAQAQTVVFGGRTFNIDNAGKSYSYSNQNGTIRTEVRSGDLYSRPGVWTDPSTSERSEIGDQSTVPNGTAWAYTFQFMVEPGAAITSRWFVMNQLHPGQGGSPPLELILSNDVFGVSAYSSAQGHKYLYRDTSRIQRGRWYTMRVEVYFDVSGGSNGYARIWRDGVQLTNYRGPLGYTDQKYSRIRFGVYRYEAPETVAINYRNFVWKTGAPGVTLPSSPTPTPAPTPAPTPIATPAPSPTPQATPVPGTGLSLVSPGFEDGLTGWGNNGNSVVTTNANSGRYAVAIGSAAGGIYQDILSKVIPGQSYRLSFYAKAGSSSDLTGSVGVNFQNGSTTLFKKSLPITSLVYQRYTFDFIAPANATSADVFAWKSSGSSALFVDDFSLVVLVPKAIIGSPVTSGIWTNMSATAQSGRFVLAFDAVPSGNAVDVVIGMSNGAASSYTSLAPIVRFNSQGLIDARNGSTYASRVAVRYSAGARYRIRMAIDLIGKTYSVYVTAPGQAEVTLASGYAFRSEQSLASTLSNIAKAQAMGSAGLSNLSITPVVAVP